MRSIPAALFAALLLTACDEGGTDKPAARGAFDPVEEIGTVDTGGPEEPGAPVAAPPPEEQLLQARFGSYYTFVTPPFIEDDQLVVLVQYGGGCAEHRFEADPFPRSEGEGDVLELDLVHDDGGDRCLALPVARHTIDLSDLLEEACTHEVVVHGPSDTWVLTLDETCMR